MLELFAGLALGILGSAAATPAAPELARQILEREKCQTALPLVDGASDAASATGATPGAEATKHRGAGESALGRLGIPAIPLWLVAIVAVGLAAIIALIWWPRRLPAASPVPRAPVATVEVQRPAPPRLADWESLAREGRFGDAIHALLLRALSDLARTDSAAAPAASLTSREVLRRATRLAADARRVWPAPAR